MWTEPAPPAPPPRPRDPRADMVRSAIFTELGRQYETSNGFDGVSWWAVDDVYCGGIEGEPDWDAVADAVIAALDMKKEPPPPHGSEWGRRHP